MIALGPYVYFSDQIRQIERHAAARMGLLPRDLMARAGQAAIGFLIQKFPVARKIAVFCGSGNNGGDGYALACFAKAAGIEVVLYHTKPIEHLPMPAREFAEQARDLGMAFCDIGDSLAEDYDVIVDALLGIGLQGEVRQEYAQAITTINAQKNPILSLDIPSGLASDTGGVLGVAVEASFTMTYIGLKAGMMTLDGPDHCGEVVIEPLGLETLLSSLASQLTYLQDDCLQALPKRKKNCHKHQFGHVLIVGGNEGMPGSVEIAAKTAFRSGAGLVTVASRPHYADRAVANLPEAMVAAIDDTASIDEYLARATVCVVGPGLGQDEWAQDLFDRVVRAPIPMVIDASALHLLATSPQRDDNWVLTPHPKEAATLLQTSVEHVQENRFASVVALQQKYGGSVILKGVGSLVCSETQHIQICPLGNPGMASAGMGDALSGVVGALIAQGVPLPKAAALGTYAHAWAANEAAREDGARGLLASDLLCHLRRFLNQSRGG